MHWEQVEAGDNMTFSNSMKMVNLAGASIEGLAALSMEGRMVGNSYLHRFFFPYSLGYRRVVPSSILPMLDASRFALLLLIPKD